MIGILGKKLGMTRIYDEAGKVNPVTVVESGPCTVVNVRTMERDGYSAVQLGHCEVDEKKLRKPIRGYLKKAGVPPVKYLREIRLNEKADCKVGDKVTVDIFRPGDFVDVTGNSIGKGFQGGMKRWHWKGGPKSRGSTSHRRPGSIGSSTSPGRVWRGHHLPGRMGNERVTVQNLRVLKVDLQNNLLVLKGAVAGCDGRLLIIRKSKKRVWRPLTPPAPVKSKETKPVREAAKKTKK